MYTIILNSRNRVDTTTTANNAQFYIDWSSILKEGKYRVKYSICKQSLTAQIPWLFRVKSLTATVPLIVDGTPLTNINNVAMVNDPIRGFVFNFAGNNCLRLNVTTPLQNTKTFWESTTSAAGNDSNVFSTILNPIWFSRTNFLRVNNSYPSGLPAISTIEQTAVWRFYAVTTTATTTSLYVDGNLVSSVSLNATGDTGSIYFGSYEGGAFIIGRVDDMRMYSQILSSSEISNIYTTTLL